MERRRTEASDIGGKIKMYLESSFLVIVNPISITGSPVSFLTLSSLSPGNAKNSQEKPSRSPGTIGLGPGPSKTPSSELEEPGVSHPHHQCQEESYGTKEGGPVFSPRVGPSRLWSLYIYSFYKIYILPA